MGKGLWVEKVIFQEIELCQDKKKRDGSYRVES